MSKRALRWSFALLSVLVAWNLRLAELLDRFASALGATPDSFLHRAIVDGGVPIAVVAIVALALWLYERWLWPLVATSDYQGGWWLYALQTPDGTQVAGFFRLEQNSRNARIPEARAFYLKAGQLQLRGNWSSNAMIIERERIQFIFAMRAINPRPKALPSQYDGYFSANVTRREPLVGVKVWEGEFHDLGDRREVLGPVYSERLSRVRRWTSNRVQEVLKSQAQGFIRRLSQA